MTQPDHSPAGIPLVELIFEWVLPTIGGVLTMVIARWLNLSTGWMIILILPGAIAFQWSCALILVFLAIVGQRNTKE